MSARYKLRYMFEWAASCLWAVNDVARAKFGYEVDFQNLPLTHETKTEIRNMIDWHFKSLNHEYPAHPGPWRQEECDRFNQAAFELCERIQRELGGEYEILNEQSPIMEDPNLDEYLKDPDNFKRN